MLNILVIPYFNNLFSNKRKKFRDQYNFFFSVWSPEIFKFLWTQKMMVFCNFLEIKAETKKVVGVKVVPFGILYSCVKFRRLKMGDPV